MKIRDARDAVRAYFAMRGKLATAPSQQGALENQLKLGGRVQSSMDLDQAQRRHLAYAEATLAVLTLTAEELEVVELRYCPDARATGAETYERVIPSADVPSATEGQGEEVIPGTARDHSGQPITGYTKVAGRRARMPDFEEIGRRMGRSGRQVKSLIGRALGKVREHIDRVREELE